MKPDVRARRDWPTSQPFDEKRSQTVLIDNFSKSKSSLMNDNGKPTGRIQTNFFDAAKRKTSTIGPYELLLAISELRKLFR